jgi:hypothetical protein
VPAEIGETKVRFSGAPCRIADADRAGVGVPLQTRGEVGGVADGGVVHAQVVADLADHHRTGVQANAQSQLAER